jgi:hypothetical protein
MMPSNVTSFSKDVYQTTVIDISCIMCYTQLIPMTYMIRKHVLLPLPLDERIKLVARRDRKSEAQVIRELLDTGLETKQQHTGSVGHALRRVAEIGKEVGATGPTDLSQNIDEYLYEED